MTLSLINILTLLITMLLSMAFYTLMERKFISLSQSRKGPNKTLLWGSIQPFSDAMKLLTKEMNLNLKSNFSLFLISPMLNLSCSMTMWMIYPFTFEYSFMKMSTLFLISCMSFNTITIMMMSWSSNSNYSFIGFMRTISQLTSYEINLILIIITMMSMTNSLSFKIMNMNQPIISLAVSAAPVLVMWMVICLAETNRTPFDFSEGESELISGFNIDFSSSSFILLFLSEYASMLLMSLVTSLMFMSTDPTNFLFYISYLSISMTFIWTRTTMPRFRYDKLMKLNWTQILPSTTLILYLSFSIKMYCTLKSQSN